MKQNVSPAVFLAIIVVAVAAVACTALWIYRAPSATAGKPVSRAEVNAAMKETHNGPTSDQLKQIQEWKKSHPGAYTRY